MNDFSVGIFFLAAGTSSPLISQILKRFIAIYLIYFIVIDKRKEYTIEKMMSLTIIRIIELWERFILWQCSEYPGSILIIIEKRLQALIIINIYYMVSWVQESKINHSNCYFVY